MDFIAVFIVCLLLLLALTVALLFGRPPVYRPARQDILLLMQQVIAGEAVEDKWSLFIGLPLVHDPELEEIRQRCYEIELAAEEGSEVRFGVSRYRYNRVGMDLLQRVLNELQHLIDNTPVYRSF